MKILSKNFVLFEPVHFWSIQVMLLLGLLLLIGSCNQDDDDLLKDLELQTQLSLNQYSDIGISDAANDGIDEFYFLNPTVGESPKFYGKFHANLSPVVEISDDFEFNTFHQVFKREETGSKQIVINAIEETYSVNWNTAETKAIKGKVYRVRVRINNRILGFVDVGIVSPQTKKLENNLTPLVENQNMRVVFRIENKKCPARIEILPEVATIPVDGEQQFEAIVYNYYDEVLEGRPITWTVVDDDIASISPSGLAKGIQAGTVSVMAQTHDVSASANLTVEEIEDPNTVTDIDGNVYKTVQIGDQTWMAEDLRTTKYNDGTNIIFGNSQITWNDEATSNGLGAYTFLNDNPINNFGNLYNKFAAISGKVCPNGWHVASDEEWNKMIFHVGYEEPGGFYELANRLRTPLNWIDLPNVPNETTNQSAFSAIPVGIRIFTGGFTGNGNLVGWWSGNQNATQLNFFIIPLNNAYFFTSDQQFQNGAGLCIRCMKD